jgi:hypothetical protein
MFKILAFAGAATLTCATAASAVTAVSVEAAGAQTTSVVLASVGTETFDALPTGYNSTIATVFGTTGLTGSYDGSLVFGANQYGGAGGIGQFQTVQTTTTLTLSGVADYFGLWASALDGGNTIEFYNGGTLIDAINLTATPLSAAYYGSPTVPFLGQNSNEKYAFFNFVVTGGYDQVTLRENGGGGFENDNHTVGIIAGAVPEPASWALMIAGFGLVGAAMRRRRMAAIA